jgi:hypothetical protein
MWGLFGGFAMEALDFITAVRRHQRWPWIDAEGRSRPGPLAYAIAVVLRLAVGAGVACAGAMSVPHLNAPWLAMGLGAAAPVVLEKLTSLIPLVLKGGLDALMAQAQQPAQGDARSGPQTTHDTAVIGESRLDSLGTTLAPDR